MPPGRRTGQGYLALERWRLAFDMCSIAVLLDGENAEVTGVTGLENRCIIRHISLHREKTKHGCSIGIFEEHSLLFRPWPC
jgi:hypothetical protein